MLQNSVTFCDFSPTFSFTKLLVLKVYCITCLYSYVVWLQYRYILYKDGTNHHSYCVAAAAVFIFGWMHTITYVKLFKDWHAFANIFKQIVAKDITKFAYIFVFILLRLVELPLEWCSFNVLVISIYTLLKCWTSDELSTSLVLTYLQLWWFAVICAISNTCCRTWMKLPVLMCAEKNIQFHLNSETCVWMTQKTANYHNCVNLIINIWCVHFSVSSVLLNVSVKPWLLCWKNYFEIILKLFQCFISHVTTSETEKIYFSHWKSAELFQNYFSDIKHVGKYSWAAIIRWNNLEIILGMIPRPEIKLFQTDVDESWNNFEIILFHM